MTDEPEAATPAEETETGATEAAQDQPEAETAAAAAEAE